MKAYKLIEKAGNLKNAITYKVVPSKTSIQLNVFIVDDPGTNEEYDYWLASEIKETKRGWTFEARLLTSKPIKIFLPRENFEKVPFER